MSYDITSKTLQLPSSAVNMTLPAFATCARRALSSKPAVARWDTDGRTLARFIDSALRTILYISVQVWITCRHYVKCRCSVCATVLTLSFAETTVSNFSFRPPKVWDVINMQNVSKHVSDWSFKFKILEHSVHDEFLLTSVIVGLNWFDILVSYQTLALLHVLHLN